MELTRGQLVLFAACLCLRAAVAFTPSVVAHFQTLVEFNSPLTSFPRLCEGAALVQRGLPAETGWAFRQPRWSLLLAGHLCGHHDGDVSFVVAALDLCCALLVGHVVAAVSAYAARPRHVSPGATFDVTAVLLYLCNPLSVGLVAAQSLGILHNLVLLLALVASMHGRGFVAGLCWAVASLQTFYPLYLTLFLFALPSSGAAAGRGSSPVRFAALFACGAAAGVAAEYMLAGGSLASVASTWRFVLTVPELTPNIGLWWYLVTEIFEEFRFFFVYCLQFSFLFPAISLAIRFRAHPMAGLLFMLLIVGALKSFPTYSDALLSLALLPIVSRTLSRTRVTFVLGATVLVLGVLFPLLWDMWTVRRSGNANFFWAICLVLGFVEVAAIFLFVSLYRRDLQSAKLAQQHEQQQQEPKQHKPLD